MKGTDLQALEQTIVKLDELLMEGYVKQTTLRQNYFQQKDKTDFNLDSFKKELFETINIWRQAVVGILDKSFREKYHLFHFIQHKGSSMTLVDMPLELSNRFISFEEYLYALEDIILRIVERRNLAIRQEIAEKEYQAGILYQITYSEHTREIKLNNIVLTKTDFLSENDNCFNYLYSNPNKPVDIEKLEKANGGKLKKRLVHIVRDLGFINELKDIFFPVVTKSNVQFVNPITRQYALEQELPLINFKKIVVRVRINLPG